ncbi:MAG TPA: iron-containing alcohol dehydrogenase [Thermoprotei archaeon]|nr:iron-containing alcohol dehydrogenase [Thermoprotei archaeon]
MFKLHIPTKIFFGVKCLDMVGEEVKEYGRKALIVTTSGGSMKKYGYLDKVIDSLERNDIEYIVYPKVSTNPTTDMVDNGVKIVFKNNIDVLIGLGGGSSIDVAKMIAAVSRSGGKASEYLIGEEIKDALPIIAVSTTHGTGSSVTHYAVLTDKELKAKRGIASKYIYPRAAFLDPTTTLSLSLNLSIATMIDALSHAVEAYVSRKANYFSKLFSKEAIKNIFIYGKHLSRNLKNIDVREKLMWANLCAGIAIDIARTTAAHALEHSLSAYYNIHHGFGLGIILYSWAKVSRKYDEKSFAELASLINIHVEDIDDASYRFVEALGRFIYGLGIREGLRDIGMSLNDVDKIIDNAMEYGKYNIDNNPGKLDREDLKEILINSF